MNEYTDTTDQMLDEEVLNEETSQETSEELTEEEVVAKAEYDKLLKENAKLKKLFSNAREHTKEKQQITNKQDNNNGLSRQEGILIAKGLTEDDLEEANFIAQRMNISVLEAVETDRYKVYKETKEKEVQAKRAQLGASRRGTSYQAPKSFTDSNLSAEEHRALFNQTFK